MSNSIHGINVYIDSHATLQHMESELRSRGQSSHNFTIFGMWILPFYSQLNNVQEVFKLIFPRNEKKLLLKKLLNFRVFRV